MKTVLNELEDYVDSESLINKDCKKIIKKKIKELLELEKEQITDAWAAGHRVAIREPNYDTSPEDYYNDQFD